MSYATFGHVQISGIRVVIPSRAISFSEESLEMGCDISKIRRMQNIIGFGTRRVVESDVTATDLSTQAAELLLQEMEVAPASLDALVFVVQNPDYFCPASACLIHQRLNLPTTCLAFDVNQGCAGYIYGLYLASTLVESGACKRVLLCAGDTPSRVTNIKNRITAPLFGDVGSATLVEYRERTLNSYYSLGADGKGAEVIIIPGGGAKFPVGKNIEEFAPLAKMHKNACNESSLLETYMNGLAVFNFTMSVVPQHIRDLLTYAGIMQEEIDYFIPHQANKQIVSSLAADLGFPLEKTVTTTFTKYGNQTIGSIACALCDSLSQELLGGTKRLLLSGFGVGLAWGSCLMHLGDLSCIKISDYIKPKDFEGREVGIARWTAKLRGE